jgi:AraC-like DNA-binding protein
MARYALHSRWLSVAVREMQVLAGELVQADPGVARRAVLAARARIPEPKTFVEECLLEHFLHKATLAALPRGVRTVVELITSTEVGSAFARSSSLARVRRLLETRFIEPWTAERLATQIGCHRTLLARQFRAQYGISIHSFLTAQRMGAAALFLSDEHAKVEAVSYLVGYRSKKNFYAAFRRSTGMTPAQFRSLRPTTSD